MKNLTTIAKLSLAGVLCIGALALSGCGDSSESEYERAVKAMGSDYQYFGEKVVKVLNSDEAQKEFGLNQECLRSKVEYGFYYTYYLAKKENGKLGLLEFHFKEKKGKGDSDGTPRLISFESIDRLKAKYPECFN